MLLSAYEFNLNEPVLPGLVTSGMYFENTISLAFVTTRNSVVIYSPYSSEDVLKHHRLTITEQITSITSGRYPDVPTASLFLGSASHIQAYDVSLNKDLFHISIPDGANNIAFGSITTVNNPLLLVGGSCTIQGYDSTGSDVYWTSTGDTVSALCIGEEYITTTNQQQQQPPPGSPSLSSSGPNVSPKSPTSTTKSLAPVGVSELIVGSEDYNIRSFHKEVLKTDELHIDIPTHICHLGKHRYGFSLANGTIGAYQVIGETVTKLWLVRGNSKVVSLTSFSLSSENEEELIVAWEDGTWEVRNALTGYTIVREEARRDGSNNHVPLASLHVINMPDAPINATNRQPGLLNAAKKGDISTLLVIDTRGYVVAYHSNSLANKADDEDTKGIQDNSLLVASLRALQEQKTQLEQELNLINNQINAKDLELETGSIIPSKTKLIMELLPSPSTNNLLLNLAASNDTMIKAVALFSNVLYKGEVKLIAPVQPVGALSIPIVVTRNIAADLSLKCIIGIKGSEMDHVFEVSRFLPKFCMFVPVLFNQVVLPESRATFTIPNERANRLLLWIQQSFNVESKFLQQYTTKDPDPKSVTIAFASLTTAQYLVIQMGIESPESISIITDDITLMGDIIKDLGGWFNQTDLNTICKLPYHAKHVEKLMKTIVEMTKTRTLMSADVGSYMDQVKTHVVMTEDARLRGRTRTAIKHLDLLNDANDQLLDEYKKRCGNNKSLFDLLKQVNHVIQKAAKLRLGKNSSQVVALCRKSLQKSDSETFIKVMLAGCDVKE